MADDRRERIVRAFLALLAETPYERVGFAEIAAAADLPLADLRAECRSKLDIVAAFMAGTDRQVLAGGDPELAEEPARERLFDVLMRRIEILKPHREAVRALAKAARRDLALALALNGLSLRSQRWMLAAAGIQAGGLAGQVRAQGLAYVMARTIQVWLDDDDPGLARTMAALDRELANGERLLNIVGDLCRFVPRFGGGRRARRPGEFDRGESAAA